MLISNLPQWIMHLANWLPGEDGSKAALTKGHRPIQSEIQRAVSSSETCCEAISKQFERQVAFPSDSLYSRSQGSYFSLKESELRPRCIVHPKSAEEVSSIVQTLSEGKSKKLKDCNFAVRGAGHTPSAGAANIENGATIFLKNLPSTGLAADHKTITISPSKTWDEVFATLDEFNLATLGGRVGGVGVGGLATGCGISYFSPRFGYTCNLVENFEVVLSDGSIVNANASSHAPLWKALHGSSNNFGIITSLTLRTFSQGKFWGGQSFHSITTRKQIFKALEDLIATAPYDPYAHFISTVAIANLTRAWFVGNSLQYTKSDPPVSFPETFKPFTDVPRQSLFPGAPDNTFRVDNHTAFTLEYAALNLYPKRWTFATATFGNSAEMMETFFQLANKTAAPFVARPGFLMSLAYQPMPTLITERNGAVDSLGPIQVEGNMFIIHIAMAADGSEEDTDDLFRKALQKMIGEAEKIAEEKGLKRDYLALTYSDSWQDPIRRRSKGTLRELRKTSEKYDPEGMFQEQVPGGFKLPKADRLEL